MRMRGLEPPRGSRGSVEGCPGVAGNGFATRFWRHRPHGCDHRRRDVWGQIGGRMVAGLSDAGRVDIRPRNCVRGNCRGRSVDNGLVEPPEESRSPQAERRGQLHRRGTERPCRDRLHECWAGPRGYACLLGRRGGEDVWRDSRQGLPTAARRMDEFLVGVRARPGEEATFIWSCRDVENNLHLWSYAGQYRRIKRKGVLDPSERLTIPFDVPRR